MIIKNIIQKETLAHHFTKCHPFVLIHINLVFLAGPSLEKSPAGGLTNGKIGGRILQSHKRISEIGIREELHPVSIPALPCDIIETMSRDILSAPISEIFDAMIPKKIVSY